MSATPVLPDETLPERLIAFAAVHNFRDLGGYPAADGRRTRWRTVFRSDGLYRLDDSDLALLRGLGLRSVLDLRTVEELETRGRFPVEHHPVEFHHLPVLSRTWDERDAPAPGEPAAPFLAEMYRRMLAEGAAQVGQAIRVLAAPGATPAVFHCAAGKDRTGVVAALLLAALGVDDDVIATDYAASTEAMARMEAWFKVHEPDAHASMERQPPAFYVAPAEAMHGFLDHVRAVHGSVLELLASVGVGADEVARLADGLLE